MCIQAGLHSPLGPLKLGYPLANHHGHDGSQAHQDSPKGQGKE